MRATEVTGGEVSRGRPEDIEVDVHVFPKTTKACGLGDEEERR